MIIPVYQGPRGTEVVYYDEDRQYLMLQLSGSISNVSQYKEGFEQLVSAVKAKKCYRIVMHLSDLQSSPTLGRAWLGATYLPKIYREMGPRLKVGVVQSQSPFQRTAAQAIIRSLPKFGISLDIQIFPSWEQAAAAIGQDGRVVIASAV